MFCLILCYAILPPFSVSSLPSCYAHQLFWKHIPDFLPEEFCSKITNKSSSEVWSHSPPLWELAEKIGTTVLLFMMECWSLEVISLALHNGWKQWATASPSLSLMSENKPMKSNIQSSWTLQRTSVRCTGPWWCHTLAAWLFLGKKTTQTVLGNTFRGLARNNYHVNSVVNVPLMRM